MRVANIGLAPSHSCYTLPKEVSDLNYAMPKFDTKESAEVYRNLLYSVVREIRGVLYARGDLIPMQNQDFFMNISNVRVQRSPENNLTVIYFDSTDKQRYAILIAEKSQVIKIFNNETKAILLHIVGSEVIKYGEPLVENKLDLYFKLDPFGTFFNRTFPKWVRYAKKLGNEIPIQ